jgi:glycosyltransferase involved in cell wall biosynthesis
MQDKPVIIFVSAVYPSQYSLLCSHLRASGAADSWFMTMPGHAERHASECDHLLSFRPDGDIVGPQSYYYSSKVERSARIGRGLLQGLQAFEKEKGKRIDVVVAHSLWAAPNLLYGEIDAAIVSYIEFPSYRVHGNEPDYPPDLTIAPSAHARSLFPPLLQERVAVQFEGFDIQAPDEQAEAPARQDPRFTVAFSSRDLSSSKGFETFMRLVDRLVREGDGQQMRFIALGDPTAVTYGYEQQWVERRYQGKVASFRDHLLQILPAAQVVEFPGKLPYDEFARTLASVDLFLYPLRYGVANWGLMEILARGGCVIGSNWGFVPELVQNDVNGLLLPDNDDAWLGAIRQLRDDPARRARYGKAARETGKRFHISNVAPRFMDLFRLAMARRKAAPLLAQ